VRFLGHNIPRGSPPDSRSMMYLRTMPSVTPPLCCRIRTPLFPSKNDAQFIILCSASNLAEKRRISSRFARPSRAKRLASSQSPRSRVHPLRSSTNCYKLSEVGIYRHAQASMKPPYFQETDVTAVHTCAASQPVCMSDARFYTERPDCTSYKIFHPVACDGVLVPPALHPRSAL
jgi:hypothetical protein